jgi:hypothetical protein
MHNGYDIDSLVLFTSVILHPKLEAHDKHRNLQNLVSLRDLPPQAPAAVVGRALAAADRGGRGAEKNPRAVLAAALG